MNLLNIIYFLGVGAICLVAGMVIEMFLDNKAIRELPQAEFDEVDENLTLSLGLRRPAR